MSALPLLAELADAGITLIREGDDLRIRARPSVNLAAFAPRIRAHKTELLDALRPQETTPTADIAPRRFSWPEAEELGLDPGATRGSIRPLEILEHVEFTMNIRLVREGDKLRMRTRPETNIPAARERVRKLRDILFEEVLQREYVDLVCCPPEQFDRARADAVFAEWKRLYGAPNTSPCRGIPQEGD